MALVQIAAPAVEPLTVSEVKDFVRIDAGNQEPAPDAPSVALGTGSGGVDNGAHRYLVTFVTAAGETQAGAPSAVVTVIDKTVNGIVALSAIQLGGSAVTARRLYRTAAAGTAYLFLATINNNSATTYSDTIADASLGAGAPTANTTDDPLISMLIKSVRVLAETRTRRSLVTQTWDLILDRFPGWELTLPKSPVQSVTSITYTDTNGALQTMASSDYLVDTSSEPGRITPAFGLVWPIARYQMGAVKVRFIAGYGDASAVPEAIKSWMLMRIATAWENRTSLVVDTRVNMVTLPPDFVDGLLDIYKLDDFSWAVE